MVFHDHPTIIQTNSQNFSKKHQSGNVSDQNDIDSSSQDLIDDPSAKKVAINPFTEEAGRSVALVIADTDPDFNSENSIIDEDLPLDYDEHECPTEDIFDFLGAGQYFGQLSLLENSPSKKASVYTKSKVHLMIVDKIAFQKMLELH